MEDEKLYTKEEIADYKSKIKSFIIGRVKTLKTKKQIIEMLYEYL